MGNTGEEVRDLVAAVAARPEVAAIELNVSCPNVKTGLDIGADPAVLVAFMRTVRPATGKPLIVKLTPNTSRGAGASGPARPWLGGGTGGQSGPAVRTVALAQVAAVCGRVAIPVVGMGGVQNEAHARQFLEAGATLVAVGTESFRDPATGSRIAAAL